MNRYKAFLEQREKINALRTLSPLRRIRHGKIIPLATKDGKECIDFSSNDYLALSEHKEVQAKSKKLLLELGAGTGAARLMSGSLEVHQQLEQEVAKLKGKEASLTFGSGYLANTGVIPAVVGRGDVIFCDRLNHASIYDGCRLSGARTIRFRHNDLNHLEELLHQKRGQFQQALIVVESIYSMDGDRCPLKELVFLKNRFQCLLMVDEAHATGIFGPNGGGIIEEDGVGKDVDLAMGTFGKALGSYGAYVAASKELILYLINSARTFIYSTALPPAVIGASLAALHIIKTKPELRKKLLNKTDLFKKYLSTHGIDQNFGPSQIVPIMVGNSGKALEFANALKEKQIFATAVRPPTVPEGTARLRFSITLHHRKQDLKIAGELLNRILSR